MTKERPIAWVDMDNTIYDFDAAILAHIPTELHVERANFHIVDDYSQELRTTIQDI